MCSMEENSCDTWTSSRLKQYLRAIRVPHSGYSKGKLLKLLKNSLGNNNSLDKLESMDVKNVSESRWTNSVEGEIVVFPDPYLLTDWDDDLTNIPFPSITFFACCLIHLMCKGWSFEQIENFGKERGSQLCNDSLINTVQKKAIDDDDLYYIRAKCTTQTAQEEPPCHAWFLATDNGNIEDSGCQCTGDERSCKHVVELMYAVANIVRRNKVCPTIQQQTSTDLSCTVPEINHASHHSL